MKISQQFIGRIGTISIRLPIITIGQKPPVIGIVTGLHGGEESGLLVLRNLIRILRRRPFRGTVRIIPSGNPLTQALKTRFSPIDFVNPNRAFPGKADGDLSQRIAAATVRALRGCTTVIDLHCFSQNCAFTGILVSSGDRNLDNENRRLLGWLAPECVWVERTATPDGEPLQKNLGGYLNSVGIPNIAVEMPRADCLTTIELGQVTKGLLGVLRGVENPRVISRGRLLELVRRDVRADQSGMFVPRLKPLAALSRGMPVGRLIDPLTFRETAVVSPSGGRLFLIARAGLVRTGDTLFAVGQPVG